MLSQLSHFQGRLSSLSAPVEFWIQTALLSLGLIFHQQHLMDDRDPKMRLLSRDFMSHCLGNQSCMLGGSLNNNPKTCLLYTSPSPRDVEESRMPSSA